MVEVTDGSTDRVLSEMRDLLVESNRLLGDLLEALSAPRRMMWNQTETAALLGVSVRLVQDARAAGRLVESSLFPGKVLFSERYLIRKLDEFDGDVEAMVKG